MKFTSGFSLVELIIVMGIMALLLAISFQSLHDLNSSEALNTDTARVLAELNEARSLTLASKNADQYGIHLDPNKITLFEGTAYATTSATNTVSWLNPLVKIATSSLAGGSQDVVFERLTGETTQNGTITLETTLNGTATRTITVYQTGATESD